MFSISSNKVAGFEPVWKQLRGFSLLFDTPGVHAPSGSLVDFSKNNPKIAFLQKLANVFSEQEKIVMTNTFSYCPLPAHSYHVTVLDGVNDDVVHTISDAYRRVFLDYLTNIQGELTLPAPFTSLFEDSELLRRKDWNIRFVFKELSVWTPSQALIVQLKPDPKDEYSMTQFSNLESERKMLYDQLFPLLGVNMFRSFTPHFSLGYFANPECTLLAKSCVPYWNEKVEKSIAEEAITFQSISLYGFDRMSRFFKKDMLPFKSQEI